MNQEAAYRIDPDDSTLTFHSITEKGVRPLNEDALLAVADSGVAAVFDGASSIEKYTDERGNTGGYIAAHVAAGEFARAHGSLEEAFRAANTAIEREHERAAIDVSDPARRFGTTVAALRFDKDNLELLQCGDSTILVINRDGRVSAPLGYHDHDLPTMLEMKRLIDAGVRGPEVRAGIWPSIERVRRESNVSYGMLNGDPRALDYVRSVSISRDAIASVLLITDGMYIPKEDPSADEDWQLYGELYRKSGVAGLLAYVREIEHSDPDLVRYPRFKMSDDATAVAIDFA